MTRLRRIARLAGVQLVVVAVVIGATEFGLRLAGLGNPVIYRPCSSYRYAPAPDQRTTRFGGATVTIDSRGVRAVDDWERPEALRVLFVGDSVTWAGTNIDDRRTFAHRTGVELERQLGRPVVVANAGVNGYGTDNMTERLRYDLDLDEDVVVVVLIAGDAIRGLADLSGSHFFTESPPPVVSAIWEAAAFAFTRVAHWLRRSGSPGVDTHAVDVARASLAALCNQVRARQAEGAEVLIVLSPYEDELHGATSELTHAVREELMSSSLPVLDLHDAVSANGAAGVYQDGVHLDEAGHELYALEIAAELGPRLRSKTRR